MDITPNTPPDPSPVYPLEPLIASTLADMTLTVLSRHVDRNGRVSTKLTLTRGKLSFDTEYSAGSGIVSRELVERPKMNCEALRAYASGNRSMWADEAYQSLAHLWTPKLRNVVSCLALDASTVEGYAADPKSIAEWASEFGMERYDQVVQCWNDCQEALRFIRSVFPGVDIQELREAMER